MAYFFAESFDLYATISDAYNGYWDSGGSTNFNIGNGRFTPSKCWRTNGGTLTMTKTSGINDAVHHFVISFQQTASISGTARPANMQLLDGNTVQCSVVFRSDGTILLTSGAPTGTIIASYPNAFAQNIWYGFEFEVVIHNTLGSFAIRRNGNLVNDFTATGLNTRNSANNYANKIILGYVDFIIDQNIDDFIWKSDASSVAWMGDVRCYMRAPATDASVQFAHTPNNFFVMSNANLANTNTIAANNICFVRVVTPTAGTLTSLSFTFNAALVGRAQMAMYDTTGAAGHPGNLILQSTELTNPGPGQVSFPLTTHPTVAKGVTYWVAIWANATISPQGNFGVTNDVQVVTYTALFPSVFSGTINTFTGASTSCGMNVAPFNCGVVNEPQQDGLTSYVFDNVAGHGDLYGIVNPGQVPVSTIAVTTRAYGQKTDAGSRSVAIQLKSGATTVQTPTGLSTGSWIWLYRNDTVDPSTGTNWLSSAVSNINVGPVIVS